MVAGQRNRPRDDRLEPPDRDAVAVPVVHDVRRRLLLPRGYDRDPDRARRRAAGRPVHPVLDTQGAPMSARWSSVLRHAVLYGLAALFLMPVYVLVVTALKNPAEVSVTRMWELPGSLSLHGFSVAWPKLAGGLRNSVVLAVPASV